MQELHPHSEWYRGDNATAKYALQAEGGFCDFSGTSLRLDGFFVEPDDDECTEVRRFDVIGFEPLQDTCFPDAPFQLGDLTVSILSRSGEILGSYELGSAAVVACSSESVQNGSLRLSIEAIPLDFPGHGAELAWDSWFEGPPTALNMWASLPEEGRRGWLEVARLRCPVNPPADAPGQEYVLDGEHVTDRVGFFCALGEAINGPGGYFGATLDGLEDCLIGGFGGTPPFTLVWRSSVVALEHLGGEVWNEDNRSSYLDEILKILNAARVRVIFI